jgi:tetratricopeptide (TPR) repeat protein
MFFARRFVSLLLVSSFLFIFPAPRAVSAQDLVATEDISGGSSVFVFRESRKKPQARSTSRGAALGFGRARGVRSNGQIAAAAQKRRTNSVAVRKRETAAKATRKEALSNTLTAKADGFLEKNQTDAAITNYRAALVQNPKNKHAAEGLSDALTAKGIETAGDNNDGSAIPIFEEAVKWDQKNDAAYAKLGSLYDSKGEKAKAIANYEKAVAANAEYSTLYAPLGVDYIEKGEIAKAGTALGKSDAAGVDNADSRFLRGLVAFHQNENEKALAAFDKTLELDGRFAEAQYYRGQTLDRMGKNKEAIDAYKTTLAIAPSFTPASFDMGVAYYNAGEYQNAEVAYKETLKNDPNNAQAHANLASTYRQMERYPEANAEYKAASNGIRNADLYSEWGYCLGKTNEWDKSVERLKTAEELSPTAIDNSNVAWGYYNEGHAQSAAKNDVAAKTSYQQAKVYSQKAVEQDPKLDAACVNLGSSHNALGEYQAAVQVLNMVIGRNPNWLIAVNQLGVGYRGMNDLVNAVATFKQAVNIDGRNTFGLYNLGEAYYASGNKKEAKKVNDKLKKIDPALSARLDNVLAGRAIDAATQQIQQKVPAKIPRVPRLPF